MTISMTNSEWTDQEWNDFSTWVRSVLRNQTATVKFTKSDGTERVMRCTLRADLLPATSIKEGSQRKTSTTSVAVWDLDLNEWRSFTLRRVSSVEAH